MLAEFINHPLLDLVAMDALLSAKGAVAQLVRIAIGFSGLSLAQRLSALHVFGLEWLVEGAHSKQLLQSPREMAAGAGAATK